MFEVEGGGGCVGVGGAVLQRRFARPLANKENNRGVMVKRREGKKRLCFRIYTPWLLTFFFVKHGSYPFLHERNTSAGSTCGQSCGTKYLCYIYKYAHNIMVGENPRVQRTVSSLRHGRMSPASVCFELVTIYHNDLRHNKGESHAHTRCCK